MSLVTGNGVYPYEHTDSWEKLVENQLPAKECFYSSLNETNISDEDYEHAYKVWNHFNIQNLGEYSDLYLKIDVLLLCDIFENFRLLCLETYKLDCAHYFTVPDFAFDAILKHTEI